MGIRNDRGEFVAARTACHLGIPPAHEAKVSGLLEAITWLNELGYQNVIIELDCKQVVDDITALPPSTN